LTRVIGLRNDLAGGMLLVCFRPQVKYLDIVGWFNPILQYTQWHTHALAKTKSRSIVSLYYEDVVSDTKGEIRLTSSG